MYCSTNVLIVFHTLFHQLSCPTFNPSKSYASIQCLASLTKQRPWIYITPSLCYVVRLMHHEPSHFNVILKIERNRCPFLILLLPKTIQGLGKAWVTSFQKIYITSNSKIQRTVALTYRFGFFFNAVFIGIIFSSSISVEIDNQVKKSIF